MRLLAFIGALAIIAAIAAATFFFGGFYSVAGTAAEPGPVNWAIAKVRDASIERHAVDNPPVSLGDMAIVQNGARAFATRGCTTCHGAPGVEWAKFSEGLRPDPPDLKDIAKEADAPELFFVIKNGIKMTGMPSFGAIGTPDDEIWSIVAFVKKLPTVSEADYKSWTTANRSDASAPPANQ
jgi:mono/diheme cytochrome c family protein